MEPAGKAGPGRDLVLENCQNCHTFVPIVVLQMDKDAWQRNSLDHRERVTTLTDEQFKTLYEYLSTNFGPHRPVPKLPKELLNRLNAELVKILKTPEVQNRFSGEGGDIIANSPDEFGRFIRAEITKWGKAVRDSGAKVD